MSGHNRARAFLGVGGNLGDPRRTMAQALQMLDRAPGLWVRQASSLYRTRPWGLADQPDFLNAVAEVETTLAPREVLDLCLATEMALKRERRERWGPRLIDLDLLLFDERMIDEAGLQVPHPRMSERAFVMVPLAEIAPDVTIAGRPAADIASAIEPDGIVPIAGRDWWQAVADRPPL